MKIIEALKKTKDLKRQLDDLRTKIATHSAGVDIITSEYPDQKKEVRGWLQSHEDICKEILKLKTAIVRTNLSTPVTIEIAGKQVTKSITEWIIRRKDLAPEEYKAWSSLTDKGMKSASWTQNINNNEQRVVNRILYFDPVERDKKVEEYRSEPSLIDAALEVVNAVTDLIEV